MPEESWDTGRVSWWSKPSKLHPDPLAPLGVGSWIDSKGNKHPVCCPSAPCAWRFAGTLTVEPTRQLVRMGSISYEVQEMFAGAAASTGEQSCCVVCLSEACNTAVLPCRHLCLCEPCSAQMARVRSGETCPICRGPVRSFLKLQDAPSYPAPARKPPDCCLM